MRILLTSTVAAISFVSSQIAEAVTVHVSLDQRIDAIGGIVVQGVEYDVCFDGSFGQTIFLGDEQAALEAASAVNAVFNSYLGSGYFAGPLPTVQNDVYFYYEVTFNLLPNGDRDVIRGQYMAGWGQWNPEGVSGPDGAGVEALFRPAIPGSIVHNVPEPSVALLGAAGLMLAYRRRR